MTAFHTNTFVPLDGRLSITLPQSFRGKNVKLSAESDRQNEQQDDAFALFCQKLDSADSSPMSDKEFFEGLNSIDEWLANLPKLSKEEYIALINSYRGTLQNVDYSDLRDETDREL